MIYIFYRSWVDTRWQQYITHLHTNSTHNTEIGKLGSAGRAPSCELYPGIALQLRKKHGKTSVKQLKELNPSAQRYLTRLFTGAFASWPCISLIYAWKTNKYTNYSFILIMYGSSYLCRHYVAIFREPSERCSIEESIEYCGWACCV
jgi:hypothetical protein